MTPPNPRWDRWFARTAREFKPLLLPYAGKPIVYVEIGCWAGACAEWVATNILTHPDSLGIGIDPYPDDPRHQVPEIKAFAAKRLEFMGERWRWLYMPSHVALTCDLIGELNNHSIQSKQPKNEPLWIDILYIDGCHDAEAVMLDFCLAWRFLKRGSLIIFDDYVTDVRPRYPNVREAVDAIEACWKRRLERVPEPGAPGRQRAFRVKDYGI